MLTGGLGAIGSYLIKEINGQPFPKTIIATGRKPADHSEVQQQLAALRHDDTTLKYYQVDVSKKSEVIRLVRDVLGEFNTLSGIIHGAGVLQDGRFIHKTQAAFNQVLAPTTTKHTQHTHV